MNFVEAIRVIKNIIPQCSANEYDGILVKRLEASNTLDEGRTTNQTHIAISGEQMNMFPYLMADGYFNCDYSEKDEQLKKYFITQIPLYIYQDNISYLEADEKSGIIFDENKKSCVCASVVRSRRKEQADQVQLSLITSDDVDFVKFRKLLHTGDFLVILKHKERLSYDCIGIRAADENNGEYHLSVLNNKFYKLPTNTKVDIKKYIKIKDSKVENRNFTISELGNILKEMYSNAENKMQVASIHIFGIKYGKNIIQKAFKSLDIVKAAGINESYSTELQKALNIYRCLEQNSYGIYISDENAIKEEKEVLGERKTGAENILLYGVPGSGKSHEIKTKYCNDEKMMERVVFHPDYTYSDFVGQILPRVEKDKDGNEKLKYVFTPGPFTRMLKKAQEDPSNHYYLVIEELNRGNAPAIFGEIFQLLDRKDEDEFPAEEVGESEYGISNYDVAKEVYGDENHPVRIPSNMNILATMNTADQNVFTLDTAFLRRWSTRQIENNFEKSEHSKDMIDGTKVSWGTFATVINDMIIDSNTDMVSSADKCLGIYFAKKKELDEDMYIGLLWMFHGDAGETKLNRLMGYMDCQLVYSYNGKIFQRICHRPFIARSRQGEHGGGSVFPTSVVEDKNHIYIYGSGSKGEMFRYQEEKDAALLRYSLRKDGFAYLATESTGDICTKALRFYGEKLYLNVCAPYGVIKVRILNEDGKEMEGMSYEECTYKCIDLIEWTPVWISNKTVNSLKGQVVFLEIEITNGELYAIRGDFDVLGANYIKLE